MSLDSTDDHVKLVDQDEGLEMLLRGQDPFTHHMFSHMWPVLVIIGWQSSLEGWIRMLRSFRAYGRFRLRRSDALWKIVTALRHQMLDAFGIAKWKVGIIILHTSSQHAASGRRGRGPSANLPPRRFNLTLTYGASTSFQPNGIASVSIALVKALSSCSRRPLPCRS